MDRPPADSRVSVFLAFFRQGLISFGGPIAHLGYFREEFVRRRGWMSDADYADLVALCQFLPGPASSQVVFGLGLARAGWWGAVAASAGFLLPSAALMIAFGLGASWTAEAGWAHGLKLAAVAVVAHAVVGMAKTLLKTAWYWMAAVGVGGPCLLAPYAWMQVVALALVGVAFGRWGQAAGEGQVTVRGQASSIGGQVISAGSAEGQAPSGWVPSERGQAPSAWGQVTRWTWCLWAFLLAVAFAIPAISVSADASFLAGVYRAGSLVFGGGHVVLPWLEELAVPMWMNHSTFLAGYGAAQALPGPLFSFAGFLGASAGGLWLGLASLITVFLPGWLLVAGGIPAWQRLRSSARLRASMSGINAGVVGLLGATWLVAFAPSAARSVPDAAIAVLAFVALQWVRCPSWLLVVICAAAGEFLARF